MHAFRKYVQSELDRRGWKASDLSARSGVSKQVLSNLLTDTRDRLRMMPGDDTIDGIASAFKVDRMVILSVIGEAMGLPIEEPTVVYDASRVPNDVLLRVLAQRLGEAGDSRGNTAPIRTERPAVRLDRGDLRRIFDTADRSLRASAHIQDGEVEHIAALAVGFGGELLAAGVDLHGAARQALQAALDAGGHGDIDLVDEAEFGLAARTGAPDHVRDDTTGEESQDGGGFDPS